MLLIFIQILISRTQPYFKTLRVIPKKSYTIIKNKISFRVIYNTTVNNGPIVKFKEAIDLIWKELSIHVLKITNIFYLTSY